VQTPAAARHLAWLDPVRAALASGDGFPRPLRTFEIGTRVTFLEEGDTRSGHSAVVSVVPADGDDGGFYFITFDDDVIQRTTEDHLADGQPVGGQQLPLSAGTLPAAVPPPTSAAVQAVIAGHAAVGGPLSQALANGGVPSAAANTLFERNAEVGHPAAGIGAPTLMGVHHGGLGGAAQITAATGGAAAAAPQQSADLVALRREYSRLVRDIAARTDQGDWDSAALAEEQSRAQRILSHLNMFPAGSASGSMLANQEFLVRGGTAGGGIGTIGLLRAQAADNRTMPGAYGPAQPLCDIPPSRAALIRHFNTGLNESMADRETNQDTMVFTSSGCFVPKARSLKQIPDLCGYFLAFPRLEEWMLANGRLSAEERPHHQAYCRKIAQYAQTYPWEAVAQFDDEFRRHVHYGLLLLRWKDEAVGLHVSILFASLAKGSGTKTKSGGGGGGGGGGGSGGGGRGTSNDSNKSSGGNGNKRGNNGSGGRSLKKSKFGKDGVNLPDGSTVCYKFNSKNGCTGKLNDGTACTRSHVCANCGDSGHKFSACSEPEGG